jgi:hypothetical protein
MKIDDIIGFTENVSRFQKGNRNNFTFLLACNLNRFGYEQTDVAEQLTARFTEDGFTEWEIQSIIKRVYHENKQEHGKYKYSKKFDAQQKASAVIREADKILNEYGFDHSVQNIAKIAIHGVDDEANLYYVSLLSSDFSFFKNHIESCKNGKIIMAICDWHIKNEEAGEIYELEVPNGFQEHYEAIYYSPKLKVPECASRLAIMKYKQAKLKLSYQKMMMQSPFITRTEAERYNKVILKMFSINQSYQDTIRALSMELVSQNNSL